MGAFLLPIGGDVIRAEYITRRGCPACEAYRKAVIEPLAAEYPDQVREHWAWGGLMERLNNSERITRIPMVVITDEGTEVMRLADLPTLERLEDILDPS